MDRVRNPYSPGAGIRPPALVGRGPELELFDVLVARTARSRTDRGLVLSGLRGVGKTVLLNEMAGRAESQGWVTAVVEARPSGQSREPFEVQLARSLRNSLRSASRRYAVKHRVSAALATFKSFGVSIDPSGALTASIDVDAARGRADSGYIGSDLAELSVDLAEMTRDNQAGVGVFIDEMQDADAEILAALCSSVHHAAQRNLPFYVIGAGLPSLPGVLSEAVTYAERLFSYRVIQHLTPPDSATVLIDPAAAEGARWEPEAVDLVVAESAGYPYFLQEYGRASWDAAPGPSITRSDVLVAIADARQALDSGFFRSRWDRATPVERQYLTAMAVDGLGPSLSSEVASRMGRVPTSLGPARANLIAKGLVYSPQHGQIAYTVPGMADFVRRQEA